MRRLILPTATILVSLSLFAQPSKNPDDAFLDRFYAVKRFEEVAISPDGKRLAWVVAGEGAFAADARITTGKHDESGPAVSPDSKHPAFLSDKEVLLDGKPGTNLEGWAGGP